MKRMIEQLKALVADATARVVNKQRAPRSDVRQVLLEEIARLFSAPPAEFIREEHRLRADLGLDELDIVELSLALEERLELPEALDLSGSYRVADVVRAIGRLRSCGSAGGAL